MSGCLHVNDVSGILVAVMKLELVNAKESAIILRLSWLLAIHRIEYLEPSQVNGLDYVLANSCQL